MKYLKSIDESFLDIFKSKSAKRLNFTEDELQFIISRVGNLINNFDAHHVNGDVSTKHMVPRKAKKEYSRIFLNMRAYYSKFEYGKLELSKYRKWSGNKFKVVYHMLSPIDYESIHQFTDGIIKQIIMWYLSVIL